jgi:hypothetical protein
MWFPDFMAARVKPACVNYFNPLAGILHGEDLRI